MHCVVSQFPRNEQVRGSIPLPGSERSEEQEGRVSGGGEANHDSPSIPLPGSERSEEQEGRASGGGEANHDSPLIPLPGVELRCAYAFVGRGLAHISAINPAAISCS